MAESFVLRNTAGDSLTLSVLDHNGLGMAPVRRQSVQGPTQHGETLVAARLRPRIVTLKLKIPGTSLSNLWTQHNLYTRMMNQINSQFYLDVTLDSGATRRLDVAYYAGLDLPREARLSRAAVATETVQLIADDPILYDTTPIVYTFGISGGGTGTPVPLLIPWTVGASTVNHTQTIAYAGTWEELPVIRINGQIEDCVITNNATGEKIDFTGTTIADSDWYEVDLRYGYKTVTDSSGANKLADLTSDSDLATWHLAPHPEVVNGNNSITVTGSNANANTEVVLTYYTRYVGL
jgi:hypothetical protein